MEKQIFYLKSQVDHFMVESVSPVIWTDYIAGRPLASPDLIILIEQFFFFN
jgi:hypothetical protein